MESKWYLEQLDDFEEDYTALVCPVGKRCCVMAIDVSSETRLNSFLASGNFVLC